MGKELLSYKKGDGLHRLELLSELFPTIAKASTEIINLESILNLPKGTEHFITDVHGEYEAFSHVLKNGSGSVKKKIDDVFGHTLSEREKRSLATLIYYPREKMALVKKSETNMEDWYKISLYRLIEVCKRVTSKYTRSKVRKALPKDFAYVIEELITEKIEVEDKGAYYEAIVESILDIGRAAEFIVALSELIQRLVVDHLHLVGDIYDRGSGSPAIMDKLLKHHSLDIQWGNHDILWMGAAAGQLSCIATVVRICARYGNLDMLEDGYGINLIPFATFAIKTYQDDPCKCFSIKGDNKEAVWEDEWNVKMHKAISIIQFKLEGQLIQKRKEYGMQSRLFLDKIDYERGILKVDGQEYPLLDCNFPTIDPENPYSLTKEEKEVMERLKNAFLQCSYLQKHIAFMLHKGGMYKVYNQNLLYHGCIPLNADGSFKRVKLYGKYYSGKALCDAFETYVRQAFFSLNHKERERGRDILWYLWAGEDSPIFGKDKMATFERYFLADKKMHKEVKNPYYSYLEDEEVINHVLREFGLSEEKSRIINGHVPVLQKDGESPCKCKGKVLVIDGGFSKAYQGKTGIAGYTLIYNSEGLRLVAHAPFTTAEKAVAEEKDMNSTQIMVTKFPQRLSVGDTDNGRLLKIRIEELKELLYAYRNGIIKENS